MPTVQSLISGRIDLELNHAVSRVPEVSIGAGVGFVLESGKVAIVAADGPRYTASEYLEEDLKNLRTTAKFAGTVNFHGRITRISEDGSSAERYSFAKDTHELIIERATLAWADGTPVEIP